MVIFVLKIVNFQWIFTLTRKKKKQNCFFIRFSILRTFHESRIKAEGGGLLVVSWDRDKIQNRLNQRKNQIPNFYFSSYGNFCTQNMVKFQLIFHHNSKIKSENLFISFSISCSTFCIFHKNLTTSEGGTFMAVYSDQVFERRVFPSRLT